MLRVSRLLIDRGPTVIWSVTRWQANPWISLKQSLLLPQFFGGHPEASFTGTPAEELLEHCNQHRCRKQPPQPTPAQPERPLSGVYRRERPVAE
jgi:hypothetical protein